MKKKYFIYLISIGSLILFIFSAQKAAAQNCPSAVAGNYTLASSCIIPANGFMVILNGNLTINAGVTLTLGSNSKLLFTTGYSLYPNGTMAKGAGAYISKRAASTFQIVNNSVTGNSCTTVCSGISKTCASIGQDSNATDTYYWSASVCTGGGSCNYNVGDCSTVMSDQCTTQNASCCGIDVYWTRCLCVVP